MPEISSAGRGRVESWRSRDAGEGQGLPELETMWRWTLNWSEVRRDILVGSCPIDPHDIDRISEDAGAGAMMSLQTDACRAAMGIDYGVVAAHAASLGLVVVNVPMRDFDAEEQRKQLPDAVRSLAELLSQGHRTYVHCTAGINRGPLVVLAYLSFVEDMAVEDAMAAIHRSRPEAAPYWDAYHGYREDAVAAPVTPAIRPTKTQ